MLESSKSSRQDPPLLGILGAGQLAQMMAQAAKRLGVRTRVAAARDDDPAVGAADEFEIVSLEDREQVTRFCNTIDLLLFESELANFSHLSPLVQAELVQTFPSLTAMQICADKFQQKQCFARLGIASPKFLADTEQHKLNAKDLRTNFPKGCVLKWSRHGYDGRGNFFWSNAGPEQERAMLAFCDEGRRRGAIIYAEARVAFVAELALVTVCDRQGKAHFYPLVQTKQRRGVCESVLGPVSMLMPDQSLQAKAEAAAQRLASDLNLQGVFAIEFFLDEDGELLANEVAPRVHNSGHATINACWGSQFENHLRAALGYPLSSCQNHSVFGMVNILGPDHYSGPARPPVIRSANAWLYWYGKSMCKPGRKMGHINLVASDTEELTKLVGTVEAELANWAAQL